MGRYEWAGLRYQMQQRVKSGWLAALALALVVVAFYLFFATRTSLFDRDEPRFAQATAEMVRSGNYLYPTFNGKLRPDKPIMIYWLMAIGVHLLGVTEIAVRLPSILAAAGSALLTFWIGRRLWDPRTGLMAMAILTSSLLMAMVGTTATADSVLLLFMTFAMALHADALMRGRMTAIHIVLLGAALGAAMLTKGPVGAVPLLAILTSYALLRREWVRHNTGDGAGPGMDPPTMPVFAAIGWAAAIGVAIFLLWAVPANRATGGQYAVQGLGHHVYDRILQPLEGHGSRRVIAVGYYFPMLVVFFFPWTLFLLGAISALLGNRLGGSRQRALLIGWTAPTFILMSLVATKLPHYILPIYPALSLAVAATLRADRRQGLTPRDRRWLHHGGTLFVAVVLLVMAIAVLWWVLPRAACPAITAGLAAVALLVKWPCMLTAVALLILQAVLVLRLHLAQRFQAAALILFVGVSLVVSLTAAFFLPAFEQLKPARALAAAIRLHTPISVPVSTCGFGEPTLNFYLGADRVPIEVLGVPSVAAWSKLSGPGVLVISEPELSEVKDRIEKHGSSLELVEIGQVRGLANSGVRAVDIHVMARHMVALSAAVASLPSPQDPH